MIYVIIGLSALFLALGLVVTENNAKYILSGYNAMSEEERQKVDLKGYIGFMRKFHVLMGLSFLGLGAALTLLIGKDAGGIFLGTFPILTYIYFITKSVKYFKGHSSTTANKIGAIVLAVILIFIVVLFFFAFKEDPLTCNPEEVNFHGFYGETLTEDQIESIELINKLPVIRSKMNGFALESIKKGYFKTEGGEVVKLILNSRQTPVILITKLNGKKIYYSAKNKSNEKVLNELKETVPNISYK